MMDESDSIQNLYDRVEVLEKTMQMLLNHLRLDLVKRKEYVYLRTLDDE